MPNKARKSKPRDPSQSVADEIRATSPIKIGPQFFKVELFHKEDWPEDPETYGVISFKGNYIRLQQDKELIPPTHLIDTFFHEILHGCVACFAHHFRSSPDRMQEEKFVQATEVGLTALFLDNPGLLALFVKYWNPANRQPSKGDQK